VEYLCAIIFELVALTFISGNISAQKTWVEKNKFVVIETENVQGGMKTHYGNLLPNQPDGQAVVAWFGKDPRLEKRHKIKQI